MRIKRIEIIGFKSFSDKTVLNIHEPITAVVGPNGCGKSNIVDAIRWCMGEQSAKHLRGGKMEDVIFGGSETRAAGGMAEVSLTFENVSVHTHADTTVEMDDDVDGLVEPIEPIEAVASVVAGEAGEAVDGADAPADMATAPVDATGEQAVAPEQFTVPEAAAILGDQPAAIDYAEYGEVTVTRRLFRDGTSEYFLNKTPCRLRDITDFFLGTGVGTKAYSIIEQGRIGQIVSAKPEDRRQIIEEAAGITKFKKKKAAAERKMDQTRQNLLRVNDIVSEIDKRLGTLRRQAQKAERYKKYRAEVRDIEMWSASHRYLGQIAERQVLQRTLADAAQRRDVAHAAHETREAAIVAVRAELSVDERRLSELTQVVFDLENRVKLGESQIDFQTREARDLDERAVAATGEIEGVTRQTEETGGEIARMRELTTKFEGEAEAHAAELARLEEAQTLARAQLADAQEELDAARAEISRAQADIARAENQQRSLERRRGDLELRLGRVVEEEQRVVGRLTELEPQISALDERLGGLRQLRLELGAQKEGLEARLLELREQHKVNEADVERLRNELGRKKSRLQSLVEIQARYEGFKSGTRSIMQHLVADDAEGARIKGLVADILTAPAEYEPAVEAVLGDRLGAVLVASHAVGQDAVAFLREQGEGRATFIPLDAFAAEAAADGLPTQVDEVDGGPRAGFAGRGGGAAGDAQLSGGEGIRGALLGLVSVEPAHAGVARYLLEDVVVVESLARAIALWDAGVRRTLVTLDGDLLDRHGVVTGGAPETAGAGVLQQKREIRELEEQTAQLEHDLSEAQLRHATCKDELGRIGATLDAIRKDTHQGEITIIAHEKDLARWQAEAARSNERRGQLERERLELQGGLGEAVRETEEATLALADARRRAEEAERRQLGLIEGVTMGRGAVDDASQQVTEAKVTVARLSAERGAARGQLGRLEETARELERRLAKLVQTVAESTTRAEALRTSADTTATELVAVREERRARAEELSDGRTIHERQSAELQVAEVEARGIRLEAERAASEANRLELRLHDVDGARTHLIESIMEKYRVALERELSDHHLRAPITDVEEARLSELRELIERMGEINLTAIEEFEELSKRFEFLTTQKKDLESALDQLERAIAKINKTSRKLFKETFDAVNQKFQEIFPRLFRGGTASLRLTGSGGDDELLDAGVEIFAQPPGKKNVTVDLLSGGEKALTAVSMIFAIFLIKPSPFCLLDEVDAPLDEANVGRYNDMVREMTDRSQFIVITHNKRTMEIADTLYGITMEEPGCSKLVSVNLRGLDQRLRAA